MQLVKFGISEGVEMGGKRPFLFSLLHSSTKGPQPESYSVNRPLICKRQEVFKSWFADPFLCCIDTRFPCLISIPLARFPWSLLSHSQKIGFSARNKITMRFSFSFIGKQGESAKDGWANISFQPGLKRTVPSNTDGAMGKLRALFRVPSGSSRCKTLMELQLAPPSNPSKILVATSSEWDFLLCLLPLNKSPLQQLLYFFPLQTKHANSRAFKPSLAKVSYCWLLSKVACIKATSLCCCFLHQ